jgi:DmsE family decaheme c-type cytochrome
MRRVRGPLLMAAAAMVAMLMGWRVGSAAGPDKPVVKPGALATAVNAEEVVNPSECASCHEKAVSGMHGTPHSSLGESCASCHKGAAAHAKAQSEGKDAPGPSLKKLSAAELSAKCLGCHDKGHQANFAGGVHDRRGVSCTSCHSVHDFKSVKGQLKAVRESETCYSCHAQIRSKGLRASHHPVREGLMGCASCHDPHDGTKPKMVSADWVNEKCLSCHTEKRGPFLWEHAPVRESCLNCHDPHGSNHEKLLVAKQPFLCQRCHLNTRHPGTLYDGRNMVAAASITNRAVEHACRNCHQNIHGSNAPSGPYLGR